MTLSDRRLVLVELNEINFDIVRKYLESSGSEWMVLRRMIEGPSIRTQSEAAYENLEPWIQWPSVHTGLAFDEHKVFRLGDMVLREVPQIFERLERSGLKVGAISAMNAVNRLRQPAYFIPDPWTSTASDGSWWSRKLTAAVRQVVNDNSQSRITPGSALVLLLGLFRYARPRNYLTYLRLALCSRGAPWRQALFLDLFLHDLHLRLFRRHKPQFSTLFINAGAHIQHHYFFNATPVRESCALRNPQWYVSPQEDPVAEMLEMYDRILGEYLNMPGVEVIVATGLSQKPYDRVKFYYRLKDHAAFLGRIGLRFKSVLPRMTRDFLIEFDSVAAAAEGQQLLEAVVVSGGDEKLFGDIDNRGESLFVTLTYPNEVTADTVIRFAGRLESLAPHVAFVAVKNGMHQPDGFAFFTPAVSKIAPPDGAHVKDLYKTVSGYFGLDALGDLAGTAK